MTEGRGGLIVLQGDVCHYRGAIAFTALGKKMFLSLVVLVLMFLYRFPDGSGTNSLLHGWVGSLAMRPALPQADGSPQSSVQFSPPGLTRHMCYTCFAELVRWASSLSHHPPFYCSSAVVQKRPTLSFLIQYTLGIALEYTENCIIHD